MLDKIRLALNNLLLPIKIYLYELNRLEQTNTQLEQLNTLLVKRPAATSIPQWVELRHKLTSKIVELELTLNKLKSENKLISILALFKN